MKVKGYFTGTIEDDPKIVTTAKKPFLAFTVASPDSYNDWLNRLKCCVYDKDLEAVKDRLKRGSVITVEGDVSAEAYISKIDSSKAVGTLRMFVKTFETFIPHQEDGPKREPAQTRQSAPAKAAPVATNDDNDSIPF